MRYLNSNRRLVVERQLCLDTPLSHDDERVFNKRLRREEQLNLVMESRWG